MLCEEEGSAGGGGGCDDTPSLCVLCVCVFFFHFVLRLSGGLRVPRRSFVVWCFVEAHFRVFVSAISVHKARGGGGGGFIPSSPRYSTCLGSLNVRG